MKKPLQPEEFNGYLQVPSWRGGTNHCRNTFIPEGIKKITHPGKLRDGVFAQEISVKLLLAKAQAENLFGVIRPLQDAGNNDGVDLPEPLLEMVWRKRLLFLLGQEFPAAFMLHGRVDDDPVPVKYGSQVHSLYQGGILSM
jgi:hypothetical protein